MVCEGSESAGASNAVHLEKASSLTDHRCNAQITSRTCTVAEEQRICHLTNALHERPNTELRCQKCCRQDNLLVIQITWVLQLWVILVIFLMFFHIFRSLEVTWLPRICYCRGHWMKARWPCKSTLHRSPKKISQRTQGSEPQSRYRPARWFLGHFHCPGFQLLLCRHPNIYGLPLQWQGRLSLRRALSSAKGCTIQSACFKKPTEPSDSLRIAYAYYNSLQRSQPRPNLFGHQV